MIDRLVLVTGWLWPKSVLVNDAFDNGLHYLRIALENLARPPGEQYDAMGDYNVAWELRDDLLSHISLLEVAEGQLTEEQGQGIFRIGNLLRALDPKLLKSANTRSANIAAMSDARWTAIREEASALLLLLPSSPFGAAENRS